MRASIKLVTLLPGILKIAWLLLLVGMVFLAAGYFTYTPWQSYSGLGCLILGYVIAILDLLYRKRHRGKAAGFYTGATVAPLLALALLVIMALIAAIVLAVGSAVEGFSANRALRLLHFLGITFAFLIVSGIPAVALRTTEGPEPEQDEGSL